VIDKFSDTKEFAKKQIEILTTQPFGYGLMAAKKIANSGGPGCAVAASAWALEILLRTIYERKIFDVDGMISTKYALSSMLKSLVNIHPRRRIEFALNFITPKDPESEKAVKNNICDFSSYWKSRWPTTAGGMKKWLMAASTAIFLVRVDDLQVACLQNGDTAKPAPETVVTVTDTDK